MAIRQDIGIVTAYGYAVSKGYEGTEEEFAQAMADVGINVSEIEASIKEFNEETVPAAMQSIIDEGNARVANVTAEGTRQMNAVAQRGANEILAVENAGTTQIGLVEAEGASQVEAVKAEGTTQVGNVNTEGTTQVAAVQAKGQEVIDSIPSDYSELTQEVSDLNQNLNKTDDYLNVDFTNIFKADDATNNMRIKTTDGQTEGAISGFYASDYLPVEAERIYKINFSYYSSGDYGMAFYSSDKTFLSGQKQSANTGTSTIPFLFKTPVNCAFVRITLAPTSGRDANDVVVSLENGNISNLLSKREYTRIKAESEELGYYINSSGTKVASAEWGILTYTVAAGDELRVTARGANPVGTVLITNANDDIIQIQTGNLIDYKFIVPDGGTILKVSNGWGYGNPAVVEKYQVPEDTGIFEVDCYGDSLTFGNQDHSGVYYPKELWKLIGRNEWAFGRYGFGGDKSAEIACMQGGIPMYAMPFTIPATTTPVSIELKCGDTSFTDSFVPADQNIGYLNDVIISGVQGAITVSGGTYYFTRSEAGVETVIARPALVFTKGYRSRNNIQVFWAGTNDTFTADTAQPIIDRISDMINFLNSKNYMVIGLTCKNRFSDIADINNIFSRVFGSHFINARDYILEYGLQDADITPTAQDETDISNGEIPTSLRVDNVHFNQYGYKIIAKLVYQKGVDLGYWE